MLNYLLGIISAIIAGLIVAIAVMVLTEYKSNVLRYIKRCTPVVLLFLYGLYVLYFVCVFASDVYAITDTKDSILGDTYYMNNYYDILKQTSILLIVNFVRLICFDTKRFMSYIESMFIKVSKESNSIRD